MLETLKLTFDTDESTITYILRHIKEDLNRDLIEEVMQAIVESEALANVVGAVKAVLCKSESETIYEA